ncbi:hypothetical protein D3C79_992500 [compost metagenome]
MRPAGQVTLSHGQLELDLNGIANLFGPVQLPVAATHQPMSGRLFTVVHGLHGLGVTLQIAKPRPAHRYPGAHGFTLAENGLIAQPQQRRLAHTLVAEDLRALLGDQ